MAMTLRILTPLKNHHPSGKAYLAENNIGDFSPLENLTNREWLALPQQMKIFLLSRNISN
jgi:hypothetical protein